MLPSEIRHEYYKSGLLPSEIRGNYMRLGPMTPGGQAAYFAKPGDYAPDEGKDTRVNLSPQLTRAPEPLPAASSAPSGSIRYSNPVQPRNMSAQPVSGYRQPVGSVRYDTRVR
jgi:hypothetical protein